MKQRGTNSDDKSWWMRQSQVAMPAGNGRSVHEQIKISMVGATEKSRFMKN